MSKSGQLFLEMQEQMTEEERWHEHHQSMNDYSEHDYATGQPEWNDTLGRCLELVYRVLKEQSGTETSAFNLYHSAEEFAVRVIANKKPCTLDEAYILMGYPEPEKPPVTDIPF